MGEKDLKFLRSREFIDEDVETLQIRLDEAKRQTEYIREYNRQTFKGNAANVESPLGFAQNRVDDLNYSLTKKRKPTP